MELSLLQRFSLIIVATLLIIFGRLAYLMTVPYIIVISIFSGIVLVWLVRVYKNGVFQLRTHFDWGLLAFQIALIVSSFNAIDPSRSWRGAWTWSAALLSFYLFLVLWRRGLQHADFLSIYFIVLAVFAVFGYLELFSNLQTYIEFWQAGIGWSQYPRISGGTSSPNILGIYLAFGLILGVNRAIYQKSNRLIWIAVCVVQLPIFIFTQSAGSFLAVVMGLSTVVFLWGQSNLEPKLFKRLVSACVFIGVAGLWFAVPMVAADSGLQDRLFIWGIALEILQEYPLFGAGLNHYASFYNEASTASLIFSTAHNWWLNILADTGMLGGISVIFLFLVTLSLGWQNRQRLLTGEHGSWMAAWLSCLVAYVAHALVETPEIWVMGIAAGFFSAVYVNLYPQPSKSIGWFPSSVWTGVGGALIVFGLAAIPVRQAFDRGAAQAELGDWSAAAAEFDQLIERYPIRESSFLHVSAIAHGMLAETDLEHRQVAIDRYEQLIELESSWAANYANLAWLHQLNGDVSAALENYAVAANIQPNQSLFALNGLQLQGETGQTAGSEWLMMDGLYFVGRSWHDAPYWSQFFDWVRLLEKAETQGCYNTPDRVPCTTHRPTKLTETWEHLAAGEREQAVVQFETFIEEEGAVGDDSAEFGMNLIEPGSWDGSQNSDVKSTIHPFLYVLWEDVAELKSDELQSNLDAIQNQTAQGFGRLGFDTYSKFVLTRPPLPYDLLPGLKCFTVDDEWAWQLTQLATWYQTNGRNDLAELIWEAMAGTDGEGIGPCIRPIPLEPSAQ